MKIKEQEELVAGIALLTMIMIYMFAIVVSITWEISKIDITIVIVLLAINSIARFFMNKD